MLYYNWFFTCFFVKKTGLTKERYRTHLTIQFDEWFIGDSQYVTVTDIILLLAEELQQMQML